MDNEALMRRIRELVEQKGMTIAELERKVGVGNHTIARWNKSMPGVDKLQRVARLLNTTIDYLVTGEKAEDAKAIALARSVESLTDEQIDLINNMIEQLKETNK